MDDKAPLRVLIVDDEGLAVERHARLCRRLDGMKVVGTLTASREVSDAVAALRPDVVLLDISMPGPDGVALARQLAGGPDATALIFATAHQEYAVAAFELAAIDYLLKPVALERLRDAMERVRATPGFRRPPSGFLGVIWVPQGPRDAGHFDVLSMARFLPDATGATIVDHYLSRRDHGSSSIIRTLEPVPPHFHSTCDEYVYVLQGSGIVWLRDPATAVPFRAGDLLFFGRGVVHCMPLLFGEPLLAFSVDTPARPADDVTYVTVF